VRRIDVETTADLQTVAAAEFPSTQVLLMAAAPADFRPEAAATGKLTREGSLDLSLRPTEDILAGLVATRVPGQTIVGFAAEHGGDGVGRARAKLARKGVDLIVLNDVSDPRIGFESAENEVTLVAATDEVEVPRAAKETVADAILDRVEALRTAAGTPGTNAV
jgi:phosphopantothenoylcysteine decarboxylase/phosphopantothenate--cysteine ligase